MKKFTLQIILTIFIAGMLMVNVSAQENASVYINGKKIEFDVQPQVIDGRTMVPMRRIFEELGAIVVWDSNTQSIKAQKESTFISMQIDNKTMILNGRNISLDVPPLLIDSRTLVPVRVIAETFGCKVEWEEATQSVFINVYTPMYARFPQIPDCGKILDRNLVSETEIDGVYYYMYETTRDSKNIDEYIKRIELLGFSAVSEPVTSYANGTNWNGMVWMHSNTTYPLVGIMLSENIYDNTLIVFVAKPSTMTNNNSLNENAYTNNKQNDKVEELNRKIDSEISSVKSDIKEIKKEIKRLKNAIDDCEDSLKNASKEKTVQVLVDGEWTWQADSRITRSIENEIEELELELELYEELLEKAEKTLDELEDLKQ